MNHETTEQRRQRIEQGLRAKLALKRQRQETLPPDLVQLEPVNVKGVYFIGIVKGDARIILTLSATNAKDAKATCDCLEETLFGLIENEVIVTKGGGST